MASNWEGSVLRNTWARPMGLITALPGLEKVGAAIVQAE